MSRKRRIFLFTIYVVLIFGGWLSGQWLIEIISLDVRPSNESTIHTMIMSVTATYILASAVPFVPGAEIGFALLIAFGTNILVLVYVSMVAALLLSYLIGRFVPARLTARIFDFLGLVRARDLVLHMAPLDANARLELLTSKAPRRIIPFLLRHRYLALAVLLNTPGNTLIGGGGGIALAAGMSGIFGFPAYVTTIVIAVSPLPLIILITGYAP